MYKIHFFYAYSLVWEVQKTIVRENYFTKNYLKFKTIAYDLNYLL